MFPSFMFYEMTIMGLVCTYILKKKKVIYEDSLFKLSSISHFRPQSEIPSVLPKCELSEGPWAFHVPHGDSY